MKGVDELLDTLRLKEMEGSLLTRAVLNGANDAGHDERLVTAAITLASYLHRADTRAQRAGMPRVPYIEHPLRNAVRLQRYGCTDQDVIIATILHDTVEDHAFDIARDILGIEPADEELAREAAFGYIGVRFGERVKVLVKEVSNPLLPAGLSRVEKHERYREHVISVIGVAAVFLVKSTDFEDNAGGLHHNLAPNTVSMVRNLANKYLPLVPTLMERALGNDVVAFIGEPSSKVMHTRLSAIGERLQELVRV